MTTAQVLERLATGPKTYAQLKGLCGNLDFLIGKLIKSKEIVYLPTGERAVFSLPKPPVQEKPLPPSREVLALQKPRKNQYSFDKEGRKKCAVCRKRRGRSGFMYGGRMWGTCYDCRDKPNENHS